mgnify:FL=1
MEHGVLESYIPEFDQVESPSPKGDASLHGLNLDWKRFVTDQTADFVKWEISALRDAGAKQPTTINMMYDFKGLDYHKFADIVDFVSWDNYPTWHKKRKQLRQQIRRCSMISCAVSRKSRFI